MSEPRKVSTGVSTSPSQQGRLNPQASYSFIPRGYTNYEDILSEREMDAIRASNAQNGWGLTRGQAVSGVKKYIDGDLKSAAKAQYRFEDINYHGLNRALDSGDARKVKEWLDSTFDNVKPSPAERKLFKRFGI